MEKPKCLLCGNVLSAESLKQNKLKRHFETVHKEHVGKPKNFFEKKCAELNKQRVYFRKAATVSDAALNASLEVSYLIAKTKTPHTIGEKLIMPAAMKMAKAMYGEEEAKKLKVIPLSDNTVKRRIDAIAADQESTLVEKLRNSPACALQMDVSTEGKNAHALTFVRFLAETAIQEDILYCLPLPEHETAQAMYNVLVEYMDTQNSVGEYGGILHRRGSVHGRPAKWFADTGHSASTICSISLPAVEAMDITNFLVLQTSYYTASQMKAYKSLEAFN